MMRSRKDKYSVYSRLCQVRNLLFFVLPAAVAGCQQETRDLAVIWKDEQARAIRFPSEWAKGIPADSLKYLVSIREINDTSATSILGDLRQSEGFIFFEPLIPFSRRSTYALFIRGIKKDWFPVMGAGENDAPKVVTSFPQPDTVPENMLKIYIQFSRPMREGGSTQYIQLVKNGKDTLRGAFLDLQPELWNEDRTVLTMWLDPGRIKRDLQPNLKFGAPLQRSEKYQLVVVKGWKDTRDLSLQQNYSRYFVTTLRDSLSPDPKQWTLHPPGIHSKDPLVIDLNETLDHFLLLESFQVLKNGIVVKGKWEVQEHDDAIQFTPDQPWPGGDYLLTIASKLEDLAGNNLNRPFDRDVTKTKQPSAQQFYTLSFVVK